MIQSFCCLVVSLSCCFVVSLSCCFVILLFCCMIVLLLCCLVVWLYDCLVAWWSCYLEVVCLEDSTERSESNPGRSLGIKSKERIAVWKTVPTHKRI